MDNGGEFIERASKIKEYDDKSLQESDRQS